MEEKKPGKNGTIKKAYIQLLCFSLSLCSVSDRALVWCLVALPNGNVHGVWASDIHVKKLYMYVDMVYMVEYKHMWCDAQWNTSATHQLTIKWIYWNFNKMLCCLVYTCTCNAYWLPTEAARQQVNHIIQTPATECVQRTLYCLRFCA